MPRESLIEVMLVEGKMGVLEMIDDQDVCDKWPKSLADKNNPSLLLLLDILNGELHELE